jgi:hypothetical protein
MVDNFDIIKSLLDFSEPKTFYFLQILKRRKENPDLKTHTKVIDNFYLYEVDDLEKLKPIIEKRCIETNSRAYINLNRLDLEKIGIHSAKLIMEKLLQGNYREIKNVYAIACGSCHSENEKRWIIDIDKEHMLYKDQIVEIIKSLHALILKTHYKVLAQIPTKSGVHIITNPFNPLLFKKRIEDLIKADTAAEVLNSVQIQKNSPTLLYYGN